MMQVKLTSDFIYVKTPYKDKDFVRDVLNGVWSKKEGMYRFPKNYHAMSELARAYPILQTNPVFMEAGRRLGAARQRLLALKAREDAPGDPRLRPYQRVDVEYLATLPCAGTFNAPRTGKTPTSIVLLQKLGTEQNLVICPASLIWNWTKEFERWAPEIRTFTVDGGPKKRQKIYEDYRAATGQRVLVVSKDTWKVDLDVWADYQFDTVLVDEAHFLRALAGSKSNWTQQAKAVLAVKASRRYALTGTPTVKHAKDVYGILHFLYPNKFPSYWQFVERYFEAPTNWFTGAPDWDRAWVKPERQAELQELIGFVSVQRKREEVMKWLPQKERIPFYVKMTEKQKRLYDQMVEDFMAQDGDTVVDTANILAQLTRMRQICLDPRLLGFDAVGAKTAALLEWLEDNPEPVVIMSMFTSYLHLIRPEVEKLGRKVGMITGEMSSGERQQAVQDFQAGRTDVVLCNIIAAGVGITLDRAETIIFTDKAWNPADNEQAEDRITPTTEDRNHRHVIITFQCQDSYDEALNHILDQKKSITDIVNEGGREAILKLIQGEM